MNVQTVGCLDWSVEDGCDTLPPEPVRGAHDNDVVLDGEGVHVIDHHMVWSGQKCWLTCQWSVLIQDHLEKCKSLLLAEK